jgi:hypothetical protein
MSNNKLRKELLDELEFVREEYNALCQWMFSEDSDDFVDYMIGRKREDPSTARFFSLTDNGNESFFSVNSNWDECQNDSLIRQEQIDNSTTVTYRIQ